MKKLLLLSLILIPTLAAPALAENYNLTSFFPAPFGNYQSIRLTPQPALSASSCTVGTIYSNSSDSNLPYFCGLSGTGLPSFAPIAGPWTLNGNDLYLSDTTTPANKKVGIGTTSPTFKLTIVNDGGILADGPAASSSSLPISGAGTRLMWYPLKGAFRAGYVSGSEWDDANIGTNSVAMGYANQATSDGSTIWGGANNLIKVNSFFAPTSQNSVIAGGQNNKSNLNYDQVLGGQNNTAWNYSKVSGKNNTAWYYGTISGGENNNLSFQGQGVTISGGANNSAWDNYSTISGGAINYCGDLQQYATVSGGFRNTGGNWISYITIAGGLNNLTGGNWAVISGGKDNKAGGNYSVVSGGNANTAGTGYDQPYTTVSGGDSNSSNVQGSSIAGGKSNQASGINSMVLGGNMNTANGLNSIVVGGLNNTANGDYSLAGGKNMRIGNANHTFLWGYSDSAIPLVFAPDTMIIYSGKMGIRDVNPQALLEINGNNSTDDYLNLTSTSAATPGNILTIKNNGFIGVGITAPANPLQFANGAYVAATGDFMNASSRAYKENISPLPVDQAIDTVLKLTPVQYNYKNEKDHQYLGFIAEDVPNLVADKNRQGLAPMDIAAVLTKVVAHQQDILKEQKHETDLLLKEVIELKNKMRNRN